MYEDYEWGDKIQVTGPVPANDTDFDILCQRATDEHEQAIARMLESATPPSYVKV